jgi:hypothetical protein
MPTKTKLSTTDKGLGYRHQKSTAGLKQTHHDGSPCDWCGRPMYLDRTRNHDYRPASTNPTSGELQGDHSKMPRSEALRLGLPIPPPDRLLHAECNRQRGDGLNDHLAAVNTATSGLVDTSSLAMPWPW